MNPFVTLLRRTLAGAALLGLATGAAPLADAAFITVDAFDDADDAANGDCTLREAVAAANTDTAVDGCAAGSGADVIIFDPGVSNPSIALMGGELLITDDLSIEGQNGASSQVTIDANYQSRIIRVGFNTTFDISNTILQNGRADLGGALRYNVGTSGAVSDVTFLLNRAEISGGALYNGGAVTVTGGEFTSNRALGTTPADGGGAIFNRGTMAVSAGTAFTFNKAIEGLGNGGAIFNQDNRTLSVTSSGGGVSFERNQAARAGGAIESGGDLVLEGVFFRFNRAEINGGALHMSGDAETTATGGFVQQNRALAEGGGFWNSADGTLTVNGVDFTGNVASGDDATQGGGALFSDGGDMDITNGTFQSNSANGALGSGGAVNGQATAVTIIGSVFNGNTANRAGGAVELAGGSGVITNASFDANVAGRTPGNGGGVHTGGTVTVTIDSGLFTDNAATEGGGVWISGGSTAFVINNTAFDGNTARGDASTQGGGGFYSDGGDAFLTDARFDGNFATGLEGSGGGINIQGGNFVFDGGQLDNNTANRAGGGIEIAGGIAVIDDVTVIGNNAGVTDSGSSGAASPGYGGGIHAGGSSNVTVLLATVASNRAVQGGGLWNGGFSEMNVRESTISSNVATNGGGLYQSGGLNGTGKLTIRRSLIAINQAANKGGGIGTRKADVEIYNTSISGNFARNGGGIATEASEMELLNVTLANNSASNRGGGAWNPDGTMRDDPFVTLSNTIAADNAAPDGNDLFGDYDSAGYNLVETTTAPNILNDATNILGTDPLLGPPADNGGPTFTHALLPGSPAIDAGQSSVAVDQRGFGRPVGADDIGAFEFGATPLVENPEVASAKTGDAETVASIGLATPNPFSATSTIELAVEATEAVRVSVYDALGREVQTAFDGVVSADAPVSVQIDGRGLSTGVYVVRVTGVTFATTQQVTIVR